jgi:hypothetical protein
MLGCEVSESRLACIGGVGGTGLGGGEPYWAASEQSSLARWRSGLGLR